MTRTAIAVAFALSASASAQFSSSKIELLAQVPLAAFPQGAGSGSSCWGYTSPSGREYAIIGTYKGTDFFEISAPTAPVHVGHVGGADSAWREMKCYDQYCYVVTEGFGGNNGIQVIDLTQIDGGIVDLIDVVDEGGLAHAHTITVNSQSGWLYANGSNKAGGGLVAVDASVPAAPNLTLPEFAWAEKYVHDSVVVSYPSGPYAGREVAFCCCGGSGLFIVDVTHEGAMTAVGSATYPGLAYCHSCSITEDLRWLFVHDELDDNSPATASVVRIFDVQDLANPVLAATYTNGSGATDHNSVVVGDFLYLASYTAGLRVWDVSSPTVPVEAGWFDTYPQSNATGFHGAWNVYAGYPSGNVIISDIEGGLFVLDPSEAISDPACGIESYGTGLGGANVASLASASSPVPGTTVQFQLAGFGGASSGFLVISGAPASAPLLGGTVLMDLGLALVNLPVSIPGGSGSVGVAIPNVPTLEGFMGFAQAAAPSPLGPQGWLLSNGLEITICAAN